MEFRDTLIALIGETGNFARTGLRDSVLQLPDFWVGHCFTSSSHSCWRQLFTTTSKSCLSAVKVWVAKFTAASAAVGSASVPASSFRCMARRLAVAHNLASGVLARRGLTEAAIQSSLKLALRGAYDEDLDNLINEHSDDVGDSCMAVDEYLVETCSFVADSLEQEPPAEPAPEESNSVEDVSMRQGSSDEGAVKFREDLDKDVETLLSTRSENRSLKEELEKQEKAFADEVSKTVGSFTSGVVEKFFPMLTFKADEEAALKNLQQEVEDRVARVAQIAECEISDVLRVAFFDLPVPLVVVIFCAYARSASFGCVVNVSRSWVRIAVFCTLL